MNDTKKPPSKKKNTSITETILHVITFFYIFTLLNDIYVSGFILMYMIVMMNLNNCFEVHVRVC